MKSAVLIAAAVGLGGLALLYFRNRQATSAGAVRNDAAGPRLPSMPAMPNMPSMPAMPGMPSFGSTSGAAPNSPSILPDWMR